VQQEKNWSSNLFEAIFGLALKIIVKAIPAMQMHISTIPVASPMAVVALIASFLFLRAEDSSQRSGTIVEACPFHRLLH
jgi:hypothetical protein